MTTKLFHYKIGFPHNAQTKFGLLHLTCSRHALQASEDDRYGSIDLPAALDTHSAKAVEIEVGAGGQTIKVVYRVPHGPEHDLVLVVVPEEGFVRTVWLNRKADSHKTLDRSKYSRPNKQA